MPNHILTATSEGDELNHQRAVIPLVADKQALRGATTAYVCEDRVCALPTSDPAVLAAQLARVAPRDVAHGEPPPDGRAARGGPP